MPEEAQAPQAPPDPDNTGLVMSATLDKKETQQRLSDARERQMLVAQMRRAPIFSRLTEQQCNEVAACMIRVPFAEGDLIGPVQNEPTTSLYILVEGTVVRYRDTRIVDETVSHTGKQVPNTVPGILLPDLPAGDGRFSSSSRLAAINTLHTLDNLPCFATTTATSQGLAWRLPSAQLSSFLDEGDFARSVTRGLLKEIFRMSETYRTPLLEQPPQEVNVASVSVAAAFEAYYRAAMNSLLNANLTGQRSALFPNMQIQIPTRVVYINGFKATRHWLSIETNKYLDSVKNSISGTTRNAVLMVPALLPGVLMTPVSGLLEASNAGHSNPEPLWRRSTRGTLPRGVREVIFGVGLNQLSEFCEERVPMGLAESKVLRNAIGSCVAGVVAGYLSHVPHNLSTLKLLQPDVSYRVHMQNLVEKSSVSSPIGLDKAGRRMFATASAILMPQGLAIRTTQIIGSFMLLNGISHMMDVRNWDHEVA